MCRAVGCAFAVRAVAHIFILEGRLLREEPPHDGEPAVAAGGDEGRGALPVGAGGAELHLIDEVFVPHGVVELTKAVGDSLRAHLLSAVDPPSTKDAQTGDEE